MLIKNWKVFHSLSNKILIFISALFVVVALFYDFSYRVSRAYEQQLVNTVLPSIDAVKELNKEILLYENISDKYASNKSLENKTIFLETKELLINRVEEINALSNQWDNKPLSIKKQTVLDDIELMIETSSNYSEKSAKLDSLGADLNNEEEYSLYQTKMELFMASIGEELDNLSVNLIKQRAYLMDSKHQRNRNIHYFIIGLFCVMLVFVIPFFLRKQIGEPVNKLKMMLSDLSKGKEIEVASSSRSDEVGNMFNSIASLVADINEKTFFAEEIGKGNYEQHFETLSEDDKIGKALLEMSLNLKANAEEDSRREWAALGVAKFSEILRSTDDIAVLSYEVISNLVKYVKANQGYLFLINTRDDGEEYLQLEGCYAYNRKKYLKKKVLWGEGLAGAAWQDMDTIFLTAVPEDYVNITSGVGESLPKSVLIVPLKINDVIYGVLEMASFNEFQKHEIAFVESLAEIVASAFSIAKINVKTKQLLLESQEQQKTLTKQDEEMRQNLEEMRATQEQMKAQEEAMTKTMEEMVMEMQKEMIENESKLLEEIELLKKQNNT